MLYTIQLFVRKYKILSLLLSFTVIVSFFITLSYTHEDALSNIAHARNSIACIQITGLPCNKAVSVLAFMGVLFVAVILYHRTDQYIAKEVFSLSVPDPYLQVDLYSLDPLKSILRKGIINNLTYS